MWLPVTAKPPAATALTVPVLAAVPSPQSTVAL
jgi:hypothetical protein